MLDTTNTNIADKLRELTKKKCGKLVYLVNEHHAKRAGLHYDFRLGYYDIDVAECVLYSWATRKFPDLIAGKLVRIAAFETELHSWDYQYFEGEIPEGYGAGINYIWERGEYELIEWIPNQKIKVTLLPGEKGNIKQPVTIVLLHIGKKENEWLMVRKKT